MQLASIQKNIFEFGTTTLVLSNGDLNDVMKTIKSIEKSGLLIKGVSGTTNNEAKYKKGGFFCMLFGTLGASLLGNILASKGVIKAGEATDRAGQNF